ncbi:hypothetical protein HMPREF9104_02224, partial [Lentilactobacillus kisonensis F0435]
MSHATPNYIAAVLFSRGLRPFHKVGIQAQDFFSTLWKRAAPGRSLR